MHLLSKRNARRLAISLTAHYGLSIQLDVTIAHRRERFAGVQKCLIFYNSQKGRWYQRSDNLPSPTLVRLEGTYIWRITPRTSRHTVEIR
jgi:hypothetical protein